MCFSSRVLTVRGGRRGKSTPPRTAVVSQAEPVPPLRPDAPRIAYQGNPTFYAVWVDESLNLMFRTVAEHAHPIKFEYRVFKHTNIIAHLGLDPRLYSPGLY